MASLLRASGAARLLVRHLMLYGPLVGSAASEYRAALAHRAATLVLAACAGVGAVVTAAIWLVLSVWNQEFRHWLLAALLALWVTASVLLVRAATSRRQGGPHAAKLRFELARDRALMREWQEAQQ